MEITFTVPAVPVAQPRPRAAVVNDRAVLRGANAKHKINAFKATVRHAAAAAFTGAPLAGPVQLTTTFIFPRPKRLIWKTRPMPREPHTGRPDVDNLVKGVADALNELVWRDDSQITELHLHKLVAAGDEQPHVEVTIRELEQDSAVTAPVAEPTRTGESESSDRQMELLR